MKNCKYFISLLFSFILICILSKYSKNNIVRKLDSINYNEIKLSENTQIINDVKFKEEFTNDIDLDLDILGQDIDKHMQSCENEYNNIFTAIKNKFDTNDRLILYTKNNIENIIDNLDVIELNNDNNNICDDSLKPIQEKRDRIQKLENYKIYIGKINTIIEDYKTYLINSYTGIIGNATTSDSILGDKQKYNDIQQNSTQILDTLILKLENLNHNYDNNGDEIIELSDELKRNLNTKIDNITADNVTTRSLIETKHNFNTDQYIAENDINGAISNLCFGSSNNTEQCIQSEWGCNLDCATKDTNNNCFIGSNVNSENNYIDIFGNKVKLHSHMHDYDHHDSSQHIN